MLATANPPDEVTRTPHGWITVVGGSEGTTPPPSPDLEGVSRGKEAGGGVSSSSPALH